MGGGWWATGWAGDVSIHIRLRVLHQVALTRVDGPAGGLFLQVGWEIELAVVGGPLDGSAMSSRVSVLCLVIHWWSSSNFLPVGWSRRVS